MLSFLAWYAAISIAGWMAFPLAFRFLRFLPDRGYTASRALGWLGWGYVFWLGTSFRITSNNPGGILLAGLIIAGASLAAAGGRSGLLEMKTWIREHGRLVISAEVVFLAAFGFWTLMRAMMPEISGTEKPMELAFINAIQTSLYFPPHDPWLSGYAISYYYFGYILVAMLARITATASEIAFNLGIALVFGLTALGAYGLVFNLLQSRKPTRDQTGSNAGIYSLPLLGPLFLLLVSNLEGFLEFLHARGLFWQQNFDGTWTSSFWKWLGILELNEPPALPLAWSPNRPAGVLYWRASRVLADYGFDGSFREVIDEFPFFSYLLGDMHPHLLAMPFALLAASLALNLFLDKDLARFRIWRLTLPGAPLTFLAAALLLGAMGFLNTWDFPIYIVLFCGAYLLRRVGESGWRWTLAGDFFGTALALGVTGGLLYLPFYVGFSSQAGGILPSLIFFTNGRQFWIMFAPLILPILAWLVYLVWSKRSIFSIRRGMAYAAILVGGLWAASYMFAAGVNLLPNLRGLFLSNQGMTSLQLAPLLLDATIERIRAPFAWLSLLVFLGLALTALVNRARGPRLDLSAEGITPLELAENKLHRQADPGPELTLPGSSVFVLLLALLGALLVLAPEFFYLLDQFGGRMNTVFKLYFQAWILWSAAAAYASACLLQDLNRRAGLIFRIGLIAVVAMSLAYAPVMLSYKTDGFNLPGGLSLDGLASYRQYNPDEAVAIDFLKSAPEGVVAEAVGGQYSAYARVATQTGLPNILGWPGHESQWRGDDEAFATRFGEVERLYSSTDWAETEGILKKYSVRYVFIGGLEQSTYRVNLQKFQDHLRLAFQQGSVMVYEVPEADGIPDIPALGQ